MVNNKHYQAQVSLLLSVLPEIAKENCFALHGGTAINLFIRNMPRLSVDIDLTYVPIEDREISLKNIHDALLRIKQNIEKILPKAQITHKKEIGKLLVSSENSTIKIEVNLVNRGLIAEPIKLTLCQKAIDAFNVFTLMPIVPFSQLYGGKICAALDRQHPRDLFDVKILLENEGFSTEVKQGFVFSLLASDRPLHEMLNPNLLSHERTLSVQFEGMSEEPFTYADYEETRVSLINTIHRGLTKVDKQFLIDINNLTPNWHHYPFEKFPSIQWKLFNLKKLKESNPDKHYFQQKALKEILEI